MRPALLLAVAIAVAVLLGGCVGAASPGSPCRATEDTLARLRDGMTYRQVAQVLGCAGTIDRSTTVDGVPVVVARWIGPGASPFSATLATFRNDRLAAFAVNGQ